MTNTYLSQLGSKKMKVKSFSDKLNVEIEKNIRMNIEEEMKVRAGKSDKKEKKEKKKQKK